MTPYIQHRRGHFRTAVSGHWSANSSTLDPLSSSLVAAYKFNTGALTTDSKGSNTLTNEGTVTETASGKSGYGAVLADSSAQYFKIATAGSDFSFGSKMTMSAWVKFTTIDSDDIYTIFLGNSGDHYIGYNVRYLSSNYVTYSYLRTDSGAYSYNGASEGFASWTPTAGTWYHLVMTVDLTAGQLKYYVDGTLKVTITTAGTSLTAMSNLYIGSELGTSRHLNATLDEVYFFKGHAATQDEVTALNGAFWSP